jgi:hypothetical protein
MILKLLRLSGGAPLCDLLEARFWTAAANSGLLAALMRWLSRPLSREIPRGIDNLSKKPGRYWSGVCPVVQAPSVSARDHRLRSLALLPVALSFRDIEEMLASWGVVVSYEAVRLWCGKFVLSLPESCDPIKDDWAPLVRRQSIHRDQRINELLMACC